MTNIESIVPKWQSLAVGDKVVLHPASPGIPVGLLESGQYICFGQMPGPDSMDAQSQPHRSWSFYIEPVAENACRLISRGCIEHPGEASFMRRLLSNLETAVDFVMEQRMLRTIKRLAESRHASIGNR